MVFGFLSAALMRARVRTASTHARLHVHTTSAYTRAHLRKLPKKGKHVIKHCFTYVHAAHVRASVIG